MREKYVSRDDGSLAFNETAKRETWRCHYGRLLNDENEREKESLLNVNPTEGPVI